MASELHTLLSGKVWRCFFAAWQALAVSLQCAFFYVHLLLFFSNLALADLKIETR